MHSFQFSTMYHNDQNRWIFFRSLFSPSLFIQFMKHLLTALFKNTQILRFKSQLSCRQIILADLLGNRSLLQRVQKFMVQLWFVIGRFRSVLCVSRFAVYNRNHNWRQRKTQLWRQLLNFRVRVWKAQWYGVHIQRDLLVALKAIRSLLFSTIVPLLLFFISAYM